MWHIRNNYIIISQYGFLHTGTTFGVSDLYRPVRPNEVEGYNVEQARELLLMMARNIDVMPTTFSGPPFTDSGRPSPAPKELTVATGDAVAAEPNDGEGGAPGTKAGAEGTSEKGEQKEEDEGPERCIPVVNYEELHFASRYLVWRNFHQLPKDVRKRVCSIEAGAHWLTCCHPDVPLNLSKALCSAAESNASDASELRCSLHISTADCTVICK